MGTVRAVVAILVVFSGIAAGLAAVGPLGTALAAEEADGSVAADRDEPVAAQATRANNSSLGGEISSLMQIPAAGTEGAVDTTWLAAYNSTTSREKRARLIAARIEHLRTWFDELESERADLELDRNNSRTVSYVARASRPAAQIEAYQEAMNRTATLTNETGANETAIRHLRNESENLTETDVPAGDRRLAVNGSQNTTE